MARFAAVLAAMAVAISGCGQTTIDARKAEEFVRNAEVTGPPLRSVHCPRGVEAKKGRAFTCTAVATDGRRYTVTMHVVGNAQLAITPQDFRPAQ